jgi:hypothetical protein
MRLKKALSATALVSSLIYRRKIYRIQIIGCALMLNPQVAIIFNRGFEVRKTAKNLGKCARLRQEFWAFTMAALTIVAPYAKGTMR